MLSKGFLKSWKRLVVQIEIWRCEKSFEHCTVSTSLKKKKKNHPPPPIRVSGSRFFLLIYQRSVPTAQPPPHHSPSFSCPNVKEPVPSINRGARWDHGALWYITSLLLLLLVQHGVSDLEWTRVGKHVTKYPLDFPELWPSSGSETDHEG